MPRPRRISTADTLAPVPADFDSAAPAQPSPVEAIEPDPAPEVPQRTPARQRLADAIEAVAALKGAMAEAAAAKSQAEERRHVAFGAKRDAEEALRQARPREVGAWTPGHPPAPALWGGTYNTEEEAERARRAAEHPPLSLADAKAALDIASDAYDSAKRAEQHYDAQIDRLSERLRWDRAAIENAVRAVVQADPATLVLAQECRRLTTRAEAARRAFSTILPHDPRRGRAARVQHDPSRQCRSTRIALPRMGPSRGRPIEPRGVGGLVRLAGLGRGHRGAGVRPRRATSGFGVNEMAALAQPRRGGRLRTHHRAGAAPGQSIPEGRPACPGGSPLAVRLSAGRSSVMEVAP